MYEEYSRQALPSRKYRELLGSAICVFNSNNSFIIETILKIDLTEAESWYELVDKTSGGVSASFRSKVESEFGIEIAELFSELVKRRNRIIHSFQITDKDSEQRLATKEPADHREKEKQNQQYIITEKILLEFIKVNEKLSDKLHEMRKKINESSD